MYLKIASFLLPNPVVIKKKSRHINAYAANLCMARMREEGHLNCGKQLLIEALSSPTVKDLINDHCFRRVQLFYYTAVVYFNEKCEVKLDKTISQVGRSGCTHCNAAHHAILPRLADNSMSVLYETFKHDRTNPKTLKKMVVLGFKRTRITRVQSTPQVKKLFKQYAEKNKRDRLIAPKSYLQRSLDSTIPLRSEINEYECIMETNLRPIALNLIQAVAYGKQPYEATEHFVNFTTDFLHKSYQATQQMIELMGDFQNVANQLENADDKLKKELTAQQESIIKKMQEIKIARRVWKKTNGIDLLKADLMVITYQLAATVMPPKKLLELGMTLEEQKLLLIKV